ncbi:MAG: Uma2 family endonuclease, partial [Chloroflexota bacterium]
ACTMIEARTTLYEDDRAFLLAFVDDREESPWMVASDYHLLALNAAVLPVRLYLAARRPDLYISGELAVRYPKPDGTTGQISPDMLAAYAPRRLRNSFNVAKEGVFPAFVLEIVSPESDRRDKHDKARLYDLLGAVEYAIFDPRGREGRQLWGYHRDEQEAWMRWPSAQRERLHSEVLRLTLEVDGTLLRFRDEAGVLIPIMEELDADLADAQSRADEAEARAAALEAELARLRRQT